MKEIIYAFWMLVGTYTGGGSEGIYVYGFDPEGARTELVGEARVENPSYLTVADDGRTIYAVSENDEGKPSYANALNFDPGTGALALAAGRETSGAAPCNIATNGRVVVTANYGGGDVSVFGVKGGGLTRLRRTLRLPESDTPSGRPSHMHCVKFSPDGRYLFVTDLGTDKILRWDVRAGRRVDERTLKTFDVPAGSGPRHFVFDGSGHNLYLINERSGTVMAFRYNGGELQLFQTVQADTADGRGSADIVLTPDGRWLYASNRLKNDGVAIFAVSPDDGRLTPAGYRATGIHPRNLSIAPGGKHLAVAARDSDAVEFYAIDPGDGSLTPLPEATVALDKPVCVIFLPRR